MSEQLPMLFGETYSLTGYVPHFNYQEVLLGLHSTRVQVGGRGSFKGFGAWDEDDDDRGEPVYEFRYSITVEGLEIHSPTGYGTKNDIRQSDTNFDIVAKTVNHFLDNPKNEAAHPVQWNWLKNNATNLNRSKRYWAAITHLNEIHAEEKKVAALQRRITRGKLVAQLRAYEVLEGRTLTPEERQIKWAEISGGLPYEAPYEIDCE